MSRAVRAGSRLQTPRADFQSVKLMYDTFDPRRRRLFGQAASRSPLEPKRARRALLRALPFIIVAAAMVRDSGHASKLLPAPGAVALNFLDAVRDPFYSHGSNDKGIGLHLMASLARVAAGFGIATVIAVPLGILIGLSPLAAKSIDPYVQVLRPVSPLAWLPIGLAFTKSSAVTALFVIAISSLWPILLNTIFGVRGINPVYLDVARTLGTSRWETLRRIVLPAAAPSIVAGLRRYRHRLAGNHCVKC